MAVSVGFIGLGNMGNPMAGNVLKNGFPMTVFDKNPKAMENLVKAGAKAAHPRGRWRKASKCCSRACRERRSRRTSISGRAGSSRRRRPATSSST